MGRSMETIRGVTAAELNDYNPEAFDAIPRPDGTYDLVPVRWMNESEYMEVEYGCGADYDYDPPYKSDEEWEAEAIADAAEFTKWERGPGAR